MPPKRPPVTKLNLKPADKPDAGKMDDAGGVLLPNGNYISKMADMKLDGVTYSLNSSELTPAGELGRGQYGTVLRVIHNPTQTVMALKEIPFANDERTAQSIITELNVLIKSKSDYIVRFYGAFFHETKVCYCMEYMDYGSLDRLYTQRMTEPVLARIAYAMVQGLMYLKEELNIMHRDVKPTNVLVNAKGEVKLCDFGVSGQLKIGSVAHSHVGCQPYMAPERIAATTPDAAYTVHSDVWSLGLSILEVGLGAFPYDRFESVFAQLQAIVNQEPRTLPSPFSDDARDFVKRCVAKKPLDRPRYVDLLKHPFLRGADRIELQASVAAWAKLGHEQYLKRVGGAASHKS